MAKQKVLLLSGGLDSTVLLYELLAENSKVRCIWIDYGQKNAREEQQYATELCAGLLIPLQCIFVPNIFEGMRSTLLRNREGQHTVQSDEVRNRNAVLISIAASHCEVPSTICVGAHKTGAAYQDATPTFYTKMARAIHWSTDGLVDVEAPFIRLTKKQIVKRAWELVIPKELLLHSVSCYEGNSCGKCPACIARSEALKGTQYE